MDCSVQRPRHIRRLRPQSSVSLSFGRLRDRSTPRFPRPDRRSPVFIWWTELGRGAFARVFLARERQLADRPVAPEGDAPGSREPQALARLQHTNIVPVYSHRVDPATGLHLLCMPYFGRITLSRVLAELRRKRTSLREPR